MSGHLSGYKQKKVDHSGEGSYVDNYFGEDHKYLGEGQWEPFKGPEK